MARNERQAGPSAGDGVECQTNSYGNHFIYCDTTVVSWNPPRGYKRGAVSAGRRFDCSSPNYR